MTCLLFLQRCLFVCECSSLKLTRLLCCGLVRGEGLFYYPWAGMDVYLHCVFIECRF